MKVCGGNEGLIEPDYVRGRHEATETFLEGRDNTVTVLPITVSASAALLNTVFAPTLKFAAASMVASRVML